MIIEAVLSGQGEEAFRGALGNPAGARHHAVALRERERKMEKKGKGCCLVFSKKVQVQELV